MKLFRATYRLLALDGYVLVNEQWVFFEAEDRSEALEKLPDVLKAMWECNGFQLELWNLYDESELVLLSEDMSIDSPRERRLFEVGYFGGSALYLDVERNGWPLFLVSPYNLARLNKALIECRSVGGQHE